MPRDFWRQIFANNIFVISCSPIFFVKSNILPQENLKNPHVTLQCVGLFEKLSKNVAWIPKIVNDFNNFNFNFFVTRYLSCLCGEIFMNFQIFSFFVKHEVGSEMLNWTCLMPRMNFSENEIEWMNNRVRLQISRLIFF